jgi:hypothetical protein
MRARETILNSEQVLNPIMKLDNAAQYNGSGERTGFRTGTGSIR